MGYPHHRYIRFLISKRQQSYEIAAECLSHALVPPSDDDLYALQQEVGIPPRCWSPTFDSKDKDFTKWLMDTDVYELWNPDSEVKEAVAFLAHRRPRQAFESLMLLHGDVKVARAEMLNTYPQSWVPEQGALELFCHYFWDIGSLDKQELFDFLSTREDSEVKLRAFGGELEYTYARLGLKQRVSGVEFLDHFIQLAHLQTINLLREGMIASGQMAAGHAALSRAAMDAIAMREELNQSTEDSDLRREAALFKAQVIRREHRAIPSFDEVRGDVIDADEQASGEDSAARIRRLPTRG